MSDQARSSQRQEKRSRRRRPNEEQSNTEDSEVPHLKEYYVPAALPQVNDYSFWSQHRPLLRALRRSQWDEALEELNRENPSPQETPRPNPNTPVSSARERAEELSPTIAPPPAPSTPKQERDNRPIPPSPSSIPPPPAAWLSIKQSSALTAAPPLQTSTPIRTPRMLHSNQNNRTRRSAKSPIRPSPGSNRRRYTPTHRRSRNEYYTTMASSPTSNYWSIGSDGYYRIAPASPKLPPPPARWMRNNVWPSPPQHHLRRNNEIDWPEPPVPALDLWIEAVGFGWPEPPYSSPDSQRYRSPLQPIETEFLPVTPVPVRVQPITPQRRVIPINVVAPFRRIPPQLSPSENENSFIEPNLNFESDIEFAPNDESFVNIPYYDIVPDEEQDEEEEYYQDSSLNLTKDSGVSQAIEDGQRYRPRAQSVMETREYPAIQARPYRSLSPSNRFLEAFIYEQSSADESYPSLNLENYPSAQFQIDEEEELMWQELMRERRRQRRNRRRARRRRARERGRRSRRQSGQQRSGTTSSVEQERRASPPDTINRSILPSLVPVSINPEESPRSSSYQIFNQQVLSKSDDPFSIDQQVSFRSDNSNQIVMSLDYLTSGPTSKHLKNQSKPKTK